MIYGNKLTQYKKTNVETATGLEIVVMCYEHAIRFIGEAKEHYESQEYMEKGRALQRALDIIGELKCSLDFERGGEIARHLDSIYNFLIRSLLEADINRDLDVFDNASRILAQLKEAWEALTMQPLVPGQKHDDLNTTEAERHVKVQGSIAA